MRYQYESISETQLCVELLPSELLTAAATGSNAFRSVHERRTTSKAVLRTARANPSKCVNFLLQHTLLELCVRRALMLIS